MAHSLALLLFLSCVGISGSVFVIPLKAFTGTFNSSALNLSSPTAGGAASSGLSLASDPAGAVRFAQMLHNLQGDAGRGYYLEVMLGTPPQPVNVLVDTGSSNFAVAGAPDVYVTKYFDRALSSTYKTANEEVSLKYSQGFWRGELGTDLVSIPMGLNGNFTINIVSILSSSDFFVSAGVWEGILGMGYALLARPDSSVEPFFDSIVRESGIPDVFSMQMCGAGTIPANEIPFKGSLILGGIEPSLYKGALWYTPVTFTWFYQVEVLKLEVGGQNLNLDCKEYNTDKAIVDSGTTLLRLPDKVFKAVVESISQKAMVQHYPDGFWAGTKVACWPPSEYPYSYFPKVSIYLRATNFTQSFRLTILPQMYIQSVGETDDGMTCGRFAISSSSTGLVIGATVMEGFFVVFDRVFNRVGFAVSTCADRDGLSLSEIAGPFEASSVSSDCVDRSLPAEPLFWITSYILLAICALVLLVLLLIVVKPCSSRCGNQTGEINDESSLVRNRIK